MISWVFWKLSNLSSRLWPRSYLGSRSGCVLRLGNPPTKTHQQMVYLSHVYLLEHQVSNRWFPNFQTQSSSWKNTRPRNLQSMDIRQSSTNCSCLVGTKGFGPSFYRCLFPDHSCSGFQIFSQIWHVSIQTNTCFSESLLLFWSSTDLLSFG